MDLESDRVRSKNRGLAGPRPGLAQPGAVGSFPLTEHQVIGLALDRLAELEAECSGAGAPPAAGRLSSGSLAWM
jgi:hypothetical protein